MKNYHQPLQQFKNLINMHFNHSPLKSNQTKPSKSLKIHSAVFQTAFYFTLLLIFIPVLIMGNSHTCPVLRQNDLKNNACVNAKPANARKYNVDCTYCHTAWPQLNRQGYQFRLLGYRMPWEVYNGTYRAKAKATGQVKGPATASNNATNNGLPPAIASNISQSVNKVPDLPSTPENIAKGAKLFETQQCITCHANGGNSINPSKPLKGPSFLKDCPDNAIVNHIIRYGVAGTAMPAYELERLNNEDLALLVIYLRSLTPKP